MDGSRQVPGGGDPLRPGGPGLNPHYPWIVVYQGYTVLVSRQDGVLEGVGREGLWDYDTRILSTHRLRLAGELPRYISSGEPEPDRWVGHLRVPRPGGDPVGPLLPQDALTLKVDRRVGCGMRERLTLRNHSMVPVDTELAIELDGDFIDIQEAGREAPRRGRTDRGWDGGARTLVLDHRAELAGREFHRGLRVRVVACDSPPESDGRALHFPLRLPARGVWRATLEYDSLVDGEWRTPLPESPAAGTPRDRARAEWRWTRTRIVCGSPFVEAIVDRAAEDLFSLRAWEYDEAPDAWFPNAGVPTYTGLFGRDALTAGWQAALLGPEMMRGALARIAATQAVEDSAWQDAEPGKLIHEMRRGPLAELGITPQRAYYGTQTTPAMFMLALSECWHWTGDDALLRRYRDVALRTFDWAERYGDRDGDGFLEYVKRSPKGLKNHAWKDSDEAIRYPDGTIVPNPIATVEEQAYHYLALLRMAEVLVALDEEDRAERFLERARRLRTRWQEAFWVEDDGFYAMALDPAKRPIRSIGSNPGHALGAGIVPVGLARRVADRLLAPDLFSGWGVRTLSGDHPSYNPLAYHLGTVWPVENATFALGFKRYGLDDHVDRIATALFAAAGRFQGLRLPELLGGDPADEAAIPTIYPASNSPQAWSASATIQLIQILLGLYPFAPAHLLFLVRPRLPAWIGGLELHRLRVGDATVSLRFRRREDGRAEHEVLERDGPLHILEAPPPDDVAPEEAGWLDALKGWILAHLPGRTARALRIALGDTEG